MADNSTQGGTDTIRDLDRQLLGIKTQVFQLDLGGVTGNAENLITAGQKTMANSVPVVIASDQTAISTTVSSNGVVSTVNSSAVALGIGAIFTGTSEDVTEYADLRVSVFTDQASATDGLQIQQSSNATNWDVVDAYTVPANTGKTFSVGVSAKFFRIVYTNGGVAQTVFRLQTKFHKTYSKGSSVRPQDARTNDNDMEEQLAHLMGFNGTSWDRLRSTIANGLLTDVSRIIAALPTGTNSIGTVQQAAITKGTQGTTGVTTQNLKDAGRNPVHYYMVIPVLSTATDTLQSLTGTKGGATVTATTTPAVVTAGKTLRITRLAATYIATATSGYGVVRFRFNTGGVVAITSPIAATMAVGSGTPATANATGSEEATLTDGWEFAAGTGIGVSVQGFAAATATAVGYILASVTGFEY